MSIIKKEKKKQHKMKLNLMTRGMEEEEWKEGLLKGKRAAFGIVEILPRAQTLNYRIPCNLTNFIFDIFPLDIC